MKNNVHELFIWIFERMLHPDKKENSLLDNRMCCGISYIVTKLRCSSSKMVAGHVLYTLFLTNPHIIVALIGLMNEQDTPCQRKSVNHVISNSTKLC